MTAPALEPRVQYSPRIRDLPSGERPRERLRDFGASALSTAELLAIILRTGTSRESVVQLAGRLLSQHGGLTGLARVSFAELCNERGMGEAKAAQLQAALELGRRLAAAQPEDRPVVRSPADVASLLMAEMMLLDQERLRVVLLNTRNQVLAMPEVYRGSVNASQVRVAEVFRDAVRRNCPAIIVVHNHPSGDPTPSADDIAVTKQLIEAGALLDIEVLDHVVIGQGRFVSLREQGLAFR
ncbi:MAG TPA: DNA repair protein RadC [Dehalococcoidia bacterium]